MQLIINVAHLIKCGLELRSQVTSNTLLEDVNNSYASTAYSLRDLALSTFIEFTVNRMFIENILSEVK